MAEKAKTYRLVKAAKELNVGISTITTFLADKGFDIDNKPTAKLSTDMYDALLTEYADEKLLKERAEQIELGKKLKEKEEAEAAAKALKAKEAKAEEEAAKAAAEEEAKKLAEEAKKVEEEAKVEAIKEVETPSEESSPEVKSNKISGPTVVGKIDLSSWEKKKKKRKETPKDSPKVEEPVAKKTKAETPVVKEESIEKAAEKTPTPDDNKEDTLEKNNEPERIKTKFQELNGPKIIGKIELPENKPKKKLVASSSDDYKQKKRKRKIKVSPGSTSSSNTNDSSNKEKKTDSNDHSKGRFDKRKKKVDKKDVSSSVKATLAKLENKKARKQKKQKRAEEGAEELEEGIIHVTEFSTCAELASLLNVTVTEVITACMNLGVMVSMNQRLDAEIIELVAEEFGSLVEFVDVKDQDELEDEEEDDPASLVERPPVVTIMGHVDHGKTSLLDHIRNENVIAGEAGGITQHIGAYSVELKDGKVITFLDTPGHEAFTAMRARGAKVTDIAIIVIAADDAIMPQTKEAISHSQAAGVSMIFAINKIDKPGANPDKIREQLSAMDILVEEWGGKFQCHEISAKHGTGVRDLLEKVLLDAEIQELKANPDKMAHGTIIEATLDKGKGYVTTLLVQAGTLNIGDFIVAGSFYGKIKAIHDERGRKIKVCGPSHPAQVLGFAGAPTAGDKFKIYEKETDAKKVANKREQIIREQGIRTKKHITLDEIGRRLALGSFSELNIIIKADVDGSVEAVAESLQKLSNEEVQINVIHKGVGQITESDVLLASASDALLIGFQVRPSAQVRTIAERENIEIKLYSVIYQAIDEVKLALEGMLEPTIEEKVTCTVLVRETFSISNVGTIAGCHVQSGKINRNTMIRIIREGVVIHTGTLASLKRYKDDVKEVTTNMECGIQIKGFNNIKMDDIIEGYEEIQIKRTL